MNKEYTLFNKLIGIVKLFGDFSGVYKFKSRISNLLVQQRYYINNQLEGEVLHYTFVETQIISKIKI